ncbi:MAG: hypothetical protein AB7L90_19940 [Hyphomicrobiaceae bacterium]
MSACSADLEYLCEITLQIDRQLAVHWRQPYLLDHRAEPLERLSAVLLVVKGLGEIRDAVAIGDSERRVKQRPLVGDGVQLGGQPLFLGIQLLELGVEWYGIGAFDDGIHQSLYLPLNAGECGLRADFGGR